MSENEQMKVFADEIWSYFEPKLRAYLSDNVSYFRAEVVANPGGNRLTVQRPFDNTAINARCTNAMANASVGDQVTVLVFGSLTNAVVVADGSVENLGGGSGNLYVKNFTATDWSSRKITVAATEHGCGTTPSVSVQYKNGTAYEEYYGYATNGYRITVSATGDVTLSVSKVGMEFAGRLVIQ